MLLICYNCKYVGCFKRYECFEGRLSSAGKYFHNIENKSVIMCTIDGSPFLVLCAAFITQDVLGKFSDKRQRQNISIFEGTLAKLAAPGRNSACRNAGHSFAFFSFFLNSFLFAWSVGASPFKRQ